MQFHTVTRNTEADYRRVFLIGHESHKMITFWMWSDSDTDCHSLKFQIQYLPLITGPPKIALILFIQKYKNYFKQGSYQKLEQRHMSLTI